MSHLLLILSHCPITREQFPYLKTHLGIVGACSSFTDANDNTAQLPENWYLLQTMPHEAALDLGQAALVSIGIHNGAILVANVDRHCQLSLTSFAQRTLH